jgi:CRP-like cAMP-binding protein
MCMIICPILNFVGEKSLESCEKETIKCTDSCLVRNHAFFCCFSTELFESLISKAKFINVMSNSLVYREGERSNKFYYVLKGSVKTYRTTQDGDEHLIDIIRSGNILAESEIFDQGNQYHNFAEALKYTEMIGFSIDAFRELVANNTQSAHNLLMYFSKILKKKNYDLEVMINCPAKQRVLIYIRELVDENILTNQVKNKKIEINLTMPKCQLAARLAMKPETLSRVLSDLRQEGLIDVDRQRVVIENMSKLIDYTN